MKLERRPVQMIPAEPETWAIFTHSDGGQWSLRVIAWAICDELQLSKAGWPIPEHDEWGAEVSPGRSVEPVILDEWCPVVGTDIDGNRPSSIVVGVEKHTPT